MFDVPPEQRHQLSWRGELPIDERPWKIGTVVGPSGCGKTSIARSLWPEQLDVALEWGGASVVDDFARDKSMQEIAHICQAVGFNTVPAWLRPFRVLSNGEQFRVSLARRLLEGGDLVVVDEFTSVVDRQVAQIGAHAVQKAVRRREGQRFVAVTCHYDVLDWLQPDWVFEPATMNFQWREVQRRPAINVDVRRTPYSIWSLFAPFHYLTAKMHRAARCYVLHVGGRPAAFAGMLHRPISRGSGNDAPIWGCARLVTLPDWQGLGLAFVLIDSIGAAYKACDKRIRTYPAHVALIRAFDRSSAWRILKRPGKFTPVRKGGDQQDWGGRPNAVFEYHGPAMSDKTAAAAFVTTTI